MAHGEASECGKCPERSEGRPVTPLLELRGVSFAYPSPGEGRGRAPFQSRELSFAVEEG